MIRGIAVVVVMMLALGSSSDIAQAHTGKPLAPHDVWRAWSWDSPVLVALIVGAGAYTAGLLRLRSQRAPLRSPGRLLAYYVGLVTLFVALVSPLDALSGTLFSAHMVQHLLLIIVAAPLLVIGIPVVPILAALPSRRRRWVTSGYRRSTFARMTWSWLTHPAVVLGLHVGVLWMWHAPALYQAALRHDAVHLIEHIGFLGTAVLFWWTVMQPLGKRRLGLGVAAGYVFIAGMSMSLLGALLTFSPTPWYPAYAETTIRFGLTPIEDQQLAGLIMWLPSAPVYLITALTLLAALLRSVDQSDRAAQSAAVHVTDSGATGS